MPVSPQVLAAEHFLLIAAIVLGAGVMLEAFARRTRIPDIALFLIGGIALGPAGAGVIDIGADSAANQLILLFGASYILFDGGVATHFAVLKRVWITVVLLATAGVVITTLVTGFAAAMLFVVPLPVGLLMASVIASTDPAALIPLFKRVKIAERLKQTVIAESAFNDAIAAILTFALLAAVLGGRVEPGAVIWNFLWEAGAGLLIGGVLGYLIVFAITHERLGFLRENLTLGTLIVVIGGLLTASHSHASGFMAVFAAGLMLGNRQIFGFAISDADEARMEDFIGTTGLIMRMFIFMLLGAQGDLHLLWEHGLPALGVVGVLTLVARPIVVAICAAPDRRAAWNFRELLFMAWTRETGVIPAALAGMLIGAGAPGADLIAAVTLMAVLVTILVQATSAGWVADKLGVLER